MVIEIAKIAKECRIKLPDIVTRPVGRKLYATVKDKLGYAGKGETVMIDFSGIKVIDSSCIDELLVKLIHDSFTEDFYIKLRNISPISEINIDSVFNSYSNYREKRIAVIREELGVNNKYYIGPLSEPERDVIDYLRLNHRANIDDLVVFSGMERGRTSAVAEELSSIRVVKKDNGEFISI